MLSITKKIKISWIVACFSSCFLMENVYAQVADIDEVKAAFVRNFIGFTTWPDSVKDSKELRLCTMDASPLSGKLERLNGVQVQGYQITIQSSESLDNLANCNIVFIPGGSGNNLDEIISKVSGEPILTISDGVSENSKSLIMINLRLYSGRIRFDVNLNKVREVSLDLSSQLLNLAQEVMQ